MGNVSSRVNGVPGYMLPKGVSRRQAVRDSQETIEHVPDEGNEEVKPSTPNNSENNEDGSVNEDVDSPANGSDKGEVESDNDKNGTASDTKADGSDNEGSDKEVNGSDHEASDNEASDKEEVYEEVSEEKVEEAEAVPDELVTDDNPEEARTISRLDNDSVRITIRGRPVVLRIPPELRDKYDPTDKLEAPEINYDIGWAYGCPQAESLEFLHATNEMVYPVGSLVVLYNIESHSQRFYTGHTNLVTCLAICPDKNIIATGQQEGHGSGTNSNQAPHVQVWNHQTLSLLTILGKSPKIKTIFLKKKMCLKSYHILQVSTNMKAV